MEQGISDQPASGVDPLARGFWNGAILAACVLATGWILVILADVEVALIAIPVVVGYLAGLVAAMRRPTRRLGFGMLIGLTLAFPVLWVLSAVVLSAFLSSP